MFENIISLPLEQTYSELKKILLDSNCKLNAEQAPNYICVTQGSLMGILPISAKKIVSFYLSREGSGTKIASSSKIATDWKNLTLYGSIVAAILIGVFMWIASDMNNYIKTARSGFWVWLVQLYDTHDPWGAIFMINIIQALTVFLAIMILFEIVIVIYVYPRKNAFSKRVLEKISN